ncbi:MAG: hypothetical protein Q7R85_01105 [bacterium]|nr:hypothetical protein [bacterium]
MGCHDGTQTSEELEYDTLTDQLRKLTKMCKGVSLKEFTAGDTEMLIYCYGGGEHNIHHRPSNATLREWIRCLKLIAYGDGTD